ncbi:MAG: cupin domain-containing protein, partial [Gaiellaceae bacterium]
MIAHWDDVDSFHAERPPMGLTVQRLGDAAGTRGIGVNRVRIDPGRLSTPPHSHNAVEETFFVLAGSGLSWQDERVCEVRAGDTIVHLADREEHTLRGGPDGLDVLAFGTRHAPEYGWLPRSRALRFGYVWTEGRVDDPWDV